MDKNTKKIRTAITELTQFSIMVGKVPPPPPESGEIRCQPQVFSPKGGPYGDKTDISFILKESASVTIKIYNMAERLERVVCKDTSYPPGMNVVNWDGRNKDNQVVPSGPYVIIVTANNWQKPKTRVVVVLNQYK